MAVELLDALPDDVRDENSATFTDEDQTPVCEPQAPLKKD